MFKTILVLLILSIAPASSSVVLASQDQPHFSYGQGFPVTLLPDRDVPTQFWNLKGGLVYAAQEGSVCLELWMNQFGEKLTSWPCTSPGVNFYYEWIPSMEVPWLGQLRQKNTADWCMGYDSDAKGTLVRALNCSNYTQTTWRRYDNTSASGIIGSAFATPKGLRLALPMPYTKYYELKNDKVRVGVSIDGFAPDKNITYVSNFQLWQPQLNTWTINLMEWPRSQNFALYSTSSISVDTHDDEKAWYHANGGRLVQQKGNELLVIGDIKLSHPNNNTGVALATETWTISLPAGTSKFEWKVDRKYDQQDEVREKTSRYATFVVADIPATVGVGDVTNQAQILSTLDVTFERNWTSASSWKFPIGNQKGYEWVFANSKMDSNYLLFSPSDICATWTRTASSESAKLKSPEFSFQWPSPQSVGYGSFGVISTNRKPVVVKKGFEETVSIELDFTDDTEKVCGLAATLDIDTGNATRDALLRNLTRQFHMFAGNRMGNSPFSVSCIFETTFYAQIASMFVEHPSEGISSSSSSKENKLPRVLEALKQQWLFFLEAGPGIINATTGFVQSQFCESGWCDYPLGMTQSHTQFLNGLYILAVVTGDKSLITDHWNSTRLFDGTISAGGIKKALEYLLNSMGLKKDKIASCNPEATGLPYAKEACDWRDIIGSGGKHAIISAEALQVLKAYADVCTWIGEPVFGGELSVLHRAAAREYNKLFWDEKISFYADWIDIKGGYNAYAYVWQQGLAANPTSGIMTRDAINNEKVTPMDRLRSILNSMDSRKAQIYKDFNVSAGTLFITPTNYISVPCDHQNLWCQQSKNFPKNPIGVYENGAIFVIFGGFELFMRFTANQTQKSLDVMDNSLAVYKTTRFFGQHYHWDKFGPDSGPPKFVGGDVLTDTNMLVWGFLKGALRIEQTATSGIIVNGYAGKELEGFRHSFYHMGKRVVAVVENGKTVIRDYVPPTPTPSSTPSSTPSPTTESPSHHNNHHHNSSTAEPDPEAGPIGGFIALGVCLAAVAIVGLGFWYSRQKENEAAREVGRAEEGPFLEYQQNSVGTVNVNATPGTSNSSKFHTTDDI